MKKILALTLALVHTSAIMPIEIFSEGQLLQGARLPIAFNPDGQTIVTGQTFGPLQVRNAQTGEPSSTLNRKHVGYCAAFSHDGKSLAVATSRDPIHVVSMRDGTYREISLRYSENVCSIAFSPDDRMIAIMIGNPCILQMYDVLSGNFLPITRNDFNYHDSMAFSSEPAIIATGSQRDKTVHVWNIETRECLRRFDQGYGVNCVAFSPNGRKIAAGLYDNTIRIFDAHTGTVLRTLTGHTMHVMCVAFSPDNTLIATGSIDGTVRIWNPLSGVCLQVLNHSSRVYDLVFSPNSTQLLSTSHDEVFLWNRILPATQTCCCLVS
jgi:WD40 repeat protein